MSEPKTFYAKYNGGLGECPVEVEGHGANWADGKEHKVDANTARSLDAEVIERNGEKIKLFTIREE